MGNSELSDLVRNAPISVSTVVSRDTVDVALSADESPEIIARSIRHGKVSVELFRDESSGIQTIHTNNTFLSYNPDSFAADPGRYVSEQLGEHRCYLAMMHDDIYLKENKLSKVDACGKNIARAIHATPSYIQPVIIAAAKLGIAPLFWLRGKTLQGQIKKSIATLDSQVEEYQCAKDTIDFGAIFIGEKLNHAQSKNMSSELIKNLEYWKDIQASLSERYATSIILLEKIRDTAKQIRSTLYR